MRTQFLILLMLSLVSCNAKLQSNESKVKNIKDSVTVIIQSNLGTLVQLSTSIDRKKVYEKKRPFTKSIVNLSSNDVDLLILSTTMSYYSQYALRPSELLVRVRFKVL